MSAIRGVAALLAGLVVLASAGAGPAGMMKLDLGGGVGLELAGIPAGEFMMGSPPGEKERQACEAPVHKVRITRAFHMGRFEVTNAQYRRFRPGHRSGHLDGDDQPALFVSWHDAQAFCRWLSKKTGKAVRLPTEAQWEYACRAGTTTRFHTGDAISGHMRSADLPKAGWYGGNSGGKSHPVGKLAANAFGLCDMHGNAWEWCRDWYGEDYYGKSPADDPTGPAQGRAKVLRGGGWFHWTTFYFRSAHRYRYRPDAREPVTGFRIVVEEGKAVPAGEGAAAQPWPPPRRIVPAYASANEMEARVAKAFGPPALGAPKVAAPKIDGRLDDPAWKKARPVAFRFLSGRAYPPDAETTAWMACDERGVYFAFDCAEGRMDQLKAFGSKRDDPVWQGDTVEIFLDPHHRQDVKDYYHIAVNPAGVVMDTHGGKASWNPPIQVATARTATGWTVEVAIPYSALGVKAGAVGKVWGVNLTRYRPELFAGKPKLGTLVPHSWPVDFPEKLRFCEDTGWSPTLSDSSHWPGRFGHAVLEAGTVETAPPGKLFELIAREDFSSGKRGRFTAGTVVDGGYMGVGKSLAVKSGDGATLLAVRLRKFRDVQLIATIKGVDGSGAYWHTFGKLRGSNKACARQVTTLVRDQVTLAPTFNHCDGAGRIDWTSKGMADPYYAGFRKHLNWFSEPTIGRIFFGGPKHWAVAHARLGDLQTQHPDNKRIDPDRDEIRGWFFHPQNGNEIRISDAVMFRGIDVEPPEAPTGVKVAVKAGKAVVNWLPARDNTLTVWYKVTADGRTVAEAAELSASIPLAKVKGKAVTVQAVDFFENVSAPSKPVMAR